MNLSFTKSLNRQATGNAEIMGEQKRLQIKILGEEQPKPTASEINKKLSNFFMFWEMKKKYRNIYKKLPRKKYLCT